MTRRQTIPEQWLIADSRLGGDLWTVVGKLPRGSAVLVLRPLRPVERRRLRHLARLRSLTLISGAEAARVHNMRELRQAMGARVQSILISPIHETCSHPDWRPLPPMRAAALARLAGRKAIALGGMDGKRFARVAPLGFVGWAGIDAWRERPSGK